MQKTKFQGLFCPYGLRTLYPESLEDYAVFAGALTVLEAEVVLAAFGDFDIAVLGSIVRIAVRMGYLLIVDEE